MLTKDEADRIRHAATKVTTTRRQAYVAEKAADLLKQAIPLGGSQLEDHLNYLVANLNQTHKEALRNFHTTLEELTT